MPGQVDRLADGWFEERPSPAPSEGGWGLAELRSISTRAEITPTRFWNEYHWGHLKADPSELLARYFDMHPYFANWGPAG